MTRNLGKGLAFLMILTSLVVSGVACVGFGAKTPEVQVVYPTVIIQQVVTQVVATPLPPSDAPQPAVDPGQPAAAGGNQPGAAGNGQQPQTGLQRMNASGAFDPLGVDIYYPLKGCIASRLHLKDKAFVAYHSDTLTLMMSPDLGDSPIRRHVESGETLTITDGPWCDMGALIWRVTTSSGEDGYVAEGNGSMYWLFPLGTKVTKLEKPNIASVEPTSYSVGRLGLPNQCNAR